MTAHNKSAPTLHRASTYQILYPVVAVCLTHPGTRYHVGALLATDVRRCRKPGGRLDAIERLLLATFE